MMKRNLLHSLALVIAGCFWSVGLPAQVNVETLPWVSQVGAKRFPSGKKEYVANKFGARSDTVTVNTRFIQKAIDECARKGGGVVTLKPGTYVTGSLFLKSNVEFRIDEGVLLLGSQDFSDYPEIDTRIAGIEMKWPAALINVIGQQNVAITGNGKINARGRFCWDKYWKMRKEYDAKGLRWIVDYDAKRVRTLLVQSSEDITLRGITISNAGFWTVQLLYSTRLTVDGLVIRNNEDGKGPSTDGIDVDSSTWVLIENCDIDCNDDDFCLKAGRDWDGLRVNRPTEYVVIRKCVARKGGGLLTLGSETSGGIRHVLATDIVAHETGNCFHIKSAVTRGGIVEDIYFQNVKGDGVKNGFHFTMNWNPSYSYSKLPAGYDPDNLPEHWKKLLRKPEPIEKGIPVFRNINISDVSITNAKTAIQASGMEESLLDGFSFKNVEIHAGSAGKIAFINNWKLDNLAISSDDQQPLMLEKCESLQWVQGKVPDSVRK